MNLFSKAKAQYLCSANAKIKKGHKKTYVEIQDIDSQKTHEVTIEQTSEGKVLDCPCMHQTYKVTRPVVCSHMITALMEIVRRTKVKT
jgi:hypothetical protein